MKDRVRESVFDLLADSVVGQEVIDLFAGTGAIGLEAMSRGASGATFIERHVPTARRIRAILAEWGLEARARVVTADSFFWLRHDWKPSSTPTLLFCSPPYASYESQRAALCGLLTDFGSRSAPGSRIVAESDERFDATVSLPGFAWRVRAYPPAILAIGSPIRS